MLIQTLRIIVTNKYNKYFRPKVRQFLLDVRNKTMTIITMTTDYHKNKGKRQWNNILKALSENKYQPKSYIQQN